MMRRTAGELGQDLKGPLETETHRKKESEGVE